MLCGDKRVHAILGTDRWWYYRERLTDWTPDELLRRLVILPVIFKNDGKYGHVKVCLLFFVLIILQDVANLEKRETTGRTQPLESSRHRLFSLRFHISTLTHSRARTHTLLWDPCGLVVCDIPCRTPLLIGISILATKTMLLWYEAARSGGLCSPQT